MSSKKVVVIGAGVIGAFSAYYLKEAGWDTAMIEKEQFGHGASYGNCGLISPSHIFPLNMPGMVSKALRGMMKKDSPLSISFGLDPDRFKWFLKFALSCQKKKAFDAVRARILLIEKATELYSALIKKEGMECEWKQSGLLALFLSEEEQEKHNTTRALEKGFGVESSPIALQDLKGLLSGMEGNISGGCFYGNNARIRTDSFMKEMKRVLIRKGVDIIEQTEVASFHGKSGKATAAVTSAGEVQADAFVLAAGAWTPFFNQAIGISLPIQPGKGYSVTVDRPDPCPSVPCLFKEKSVVAMPWESGYRIGGTMEFSGYNRKINQERIHSMIKGHGEYFPAMDLDKGRKDWCGWRPMTYDGLPIIDRAPALRNVVIAAGHNMIGMSAGPFTGKLVTDMLCEKSPGVDMAPFGCRR